METVIYILAGIGAAALLCSVIWLVAGWWHLSQRDLVFRRDQQWVEDENGAVRNFPLRRYSDRDWDEPRENGGTSNIQQSLVRDAVERGPYLER